MDVECAIDKLNQKACTAYFGNCMFDYWYLNMAKCEMCECVELIC